MSAKIRIAVDAMSGDLGPRVAIAAAIKAVAFNSEVEFLLVGDSVQLHSLLTLYKHSGHPRLTVIHASDVISMDDDPLSALRYKKQSSMWQSVGLLHDGLVDACVSGGNTGALMAISKHLLKTFPGIERPAICRAMPAERGCNYMLDLGANLVCTPEQLHQFALMGSVLATTDQLKKPRVALLNVGIESTKGTDTIKRSHEIFQQDSRINYVGFIEGDEIYRDRADVIVCDGFSGNIALKSSEGVARLIAGKFEKTFTQHWHLKLLALLIKPLLRQWQRELDPAIYNGASFLGLQKIVIKSHGGAGEQAFFQALIVAKSQVEQKVPQRIREKLMSLI